MATHSSVLTGKIPWTERSLAGCGPSGHKESNTNEVTERARTAVSACMFLLQLSVTFS